MTGGENRLGLWTQAQTPFLQRQGMGEVASHSNSATSGRFLTYLNLETPHYSPIEMSEELDSMNGMALRRVDHGGH